MPLLRHLQSAFSKLPRYSGLVSAKAFPLSLFSFPIAGFSRSARHGLFQFEVLKLMPLKIRYVFLILTPKYRDNPSYPNRLFVALITLTGIPNNPNNRNNLL